MINLHPHWTCAFVVQTVKIEFGKRRVKMNRGPIMTIIITKTLNIMRPTIYTFGNRTKRTNPLRIIQ